jgi:hypothetical protein
MVAQELQVQFRVLLQLMLEVVVAGLFLQIMPHQEA